MSRSERHAVKFFPSEFFHLINIGISMMIYVSAKSDRTWSR